MSKQFFRARIRVKDFYLGLAFLLFALLLIFWLIPNYVGDPLTQSHLKVRPGTLPDLIGYLLVFLSLLLIYQSPRTSILVSRSEDKRFSWTIVVFIASIFLFYFVSLLVGLLPSSMVIMFVLMRIYGYKKTWINVVIAVVLPIVLFVFFEKVAQVQIPRGIWFEDLY
ncbi:tripartite tricarboxylate transporter TctB family protein [Desulfoferula mesophila]|uniref:tripartite tricarboxylate transporter TctB family protein n=1 Tax=Desulfoferula mesophila TaxID=3058419 RepID=UPI0030CEEFD4